MEKVVGYRDAESYAKVLGDLQKKVAALGPLSGPDRVRKSFEAAERSFGKKDFSTAFGLYQQIASEAAQFVEVDQAKQRLAEINQLADAAMSKAKSLFESKDYAGCALSLKDVAIDFQGTPAEEQAIALKDSMSEIPEARQAFREVIAEQLLAWARDEIADRNYVNALSRLELLQSRFAELPAGREAQRELTRLKSDSQVMSKAMDEAAEPQCKTWLSLARSWAKGKRTDRARAYYERVIETFPKSSFAETAKLELKLLPGDNS